MAHKRKYTCNYRYFETINSEEKAYWLGFIMADGMVGQQTRERKLKTMTSIQTRTYFQIALAIKDRGHIEKLSNALDSTYAIRDYGSVNRYSRLIIEDNDLCNDLINLGVVPKKTFVASMPTLTKDLIIHFIRGYFDGDGCLSRHASKYGGGLEYEFSITGTKEMLTSIIEHLPVNQDVKMKQRHPERCTNNWTIKFCGNTQTLRVMRLLYSNANVCLDRKYELYKELEEYNSRLQK